MTDDEIRNVLKGFEEEIFFHCGTIEKAREIRRRLDAFIKENNITLEQLAEFTDSGAGETLYMMASAPTKEERLAMREQ
ncbi:MAG: hypothetical protein ACOYI8_03375 [Christensenellales bacterium]|jgi:hypothetical protein